MVVRLRPATPADAELLRRWDEQPHVVAADPNDDWGWETELARAPAWREQLIAELDGRPLGFVQIIDPALEDSHYWGEVPDGLRAIDIWIGEAADLGRGYGTQMMQLALARCFAPPSVSAVLIDPLATNVRAHRFYERLGFRFLERRRFGQDDCCVYRLEREDWLRSQAVPGVGAHDAPLDGVRDGYDRWAAVYDHDANPLQALEGPLLRAAVGDPRGLEALDLGCGTGRHALWLAEAGARVCALDFSEGMLAQARAKPGADRVRFLAHDLTQRLPFADGAFDLVVSGLVLEHLPRLEPFFAEAQRVLRSGGRAVVSAMHPAMCLRGAQARFTDPGSGERVAPGSRAYSVAEFVMAAVRGGFALEDVSEHAPDAALSDQHPRAGKYLGWPMLVLMILRRT